MTGQRYVAVRRATTLAKRAVKKPPKIPSLAYERQPFPPDELATELWLPIAGYEGRYAVSSLGRIKSLIVGRIPIRNGGYRECMGGIRKTRLDRNGREDIRLRANGKARTLSISRTVATTFHPNPNQLPEVNHLDGDPLNNRANNLEWDTVEGNRQHAVDNRLQPSLSVELVSEIQKEYRSRTESNTANEIAQKYGVSVWTVRRIGMPSSTYLSNPSPSNSASNGN